jgi:hypothetical protein
MHCNRGVGERNLNVNTGELTQWYTITSTNTVSKRKSANDKYGPIQNRHSTQNHTRTLNYNVTSRQ